MYSDEDDEVRVAKAAKDLTRSMWQFFDEARPKRDGGGLHISEKDEDGERKTRTIDGSCIFLNRKGHEADGFTGSFGCVLHHLAQKKDATSSIQNPTFVGNCLCEEVLKLVKLANANIQ